MDEKIYFINFNKDLSQLVDIIKSNYNVPQDESAFLNNAKSFKNVPVLIWNPEYEAFHYATGRKFQLKQAWFLYEKPQIKVLYKNKTELENVDPSDLDNILSLLFKK